LSLNMFEQTPINQILTNTQPISSSENDPIQLTLL
jgi:hypothetical protein